MLQEGNGQTYQCRKPNAAQQSTGLKFFLGYNRSEKDNNLTTINPVFLVSDAVQHMNLSVPPEGSSQVVSLSNEILQLS